MNDRKRRMSDVPPEIDAFGALSSFSGDVAVQNINNLVNLPTNCIPSSYRPSMPVNTFSRAGKDRVPGALAWGNDLSALTPPTGICNQYLQDERRCLRNVDQMAQFVASLRTCFRARENMTIQRESHSGHRSMFLQQFIHNGSTSP